MGENLPPSSTPQAANSSPGETPASACGSEGDARHTWTSQELLGKEREALIQHGGDLYRLRLTRHGKLILYK